MDHFEDQFLADNPETLGLNFEDEAKFFDPEAAHIVLRAKWKKVVCTPVDI